MKSNKGEFLEITKSDIHAQIFEEGMERTLFAYALPTAVQIWTHIAKSGEKHPIGPQFKMIRNFINKQRYDEAVLEGNVSMGFWGAEIYKYAETLLRDGKKKEGLEVLRKLVATSPFHYHAHMAIIENSNDQKTAFSSSKVIIKGSEDPKLVVKAAKFLGQETLTFDSLPLLSRYERGLQVILIPLEPCDVSLLRMYPRHTKK
jgi:hypothetical protein